MTQGQPLSVLRAQLGEEAQALAAALADGDLAPELLLELTRQFCHTIQQHLEALTQDGLADNRAELRQLHALLKLLSDRALSRQDEVRQALLSLKRSAKVKQCYGK